MYRVHTLILVFLDALATGAGSVVPITASEGGAAGGVINGRIVVRASGKRRVKNSVEDWRYVLDTDDDEWRGEDDDASDDIEETRP